VNNDFRQYLSVESWKSKAVEDHSGLGFFAQEEMENWSLGMIVSYKPQFYQQWQVLCVEKLVISQKVLTCVVRKM